MTKIEFELFGLKLMEPMAFVLTTLLSVVCFYLYNELKKQPDNVINKYWKKFFLLFGISAFFGGLSHVFFNYLGMPGKIPNWILGVGAISIMELAMCTALSAEWRKRMAVVIYTKTALVLVILVIDFDFIWVIIHTALGFFLFSGIPSLVQVARGKSEYRFFVLAFFAMLVSGAVKLGGYDFHLWMNRDDVPHLFMFLTLISFYKGSKELQAAKAELALQRR